MFGNKEKTEKTPATPNSMALNTLVEGTIIEGQVSAKSDIRVDGIIRGTLNCNGKVIIGETGRVEGQINCENAVVQGFFEGTMSVKEMLNVRQTATIEGEINTGKLVVEAGAVFNVTCRMGSQHENATTTPTTERKAAVSAKRLAKEAS